MTSADIIIMYGGQGAGLTTRQDAVTTWFALPPSQAGALVHTSVIPE